MANRVPASILIGGLVTPDLFSALVEKIQFEGLAVQWGGEIFDASHRIVGEPLALFDEECAWGQFDQLEAFCVEHKLPFIRWAGGYPGEWSPERLIFRSDGQPDSYMVDESDNVVVDRRMIVELGSFEAALGYFEAAEFEIPPLVVEGDPPPPPAPVPVPPPAAAPGQLGEARHG